MTGSPLPGPQGGLAQLVFSLSLASLSLVVGLVTFRVSLARLSKRESLLIGVAPGSGLVANTRRTWTGFDTTRVEHGRGLVQLASNMDGAWLDTHGT